jgi:hypothetical protein
MSLLVNLIASSGLPRDQHSIFVATGPETGHVYQVTGNIQQGMRCEDKTSSNPEPWADFYNKVYLGRVVEENYAEIKGICEGVAPPAKQFDGPRRIEPEVLLRRCQEWTREVIEVLERKKVLEK